MANLSKYPPNMAPQDALVVREQLEKRAEYAVAPYTAEELSRPAVGPANPYRDTSTALKRRNIPTGHVEETFISEHTFRSKYRAIERKGGPEREQQSGAQLKHEASKLRSTRQSKGNALVAEGDDAYVGPWAQYQAKHYEKLDDNEQVGSDGEYEIVEVTDDEDLKNVVESGTTNHAPVEALAKRKVVEAMGEETTTFHGESEYDYLGRTYMHVPQDLGFSLKKEIGSITNYIPKKVIHVWKGHKGSVTAVRLFPDSGHLMLSGSADNTVKIWDVYHSRSLLRTFNGHTKAITDLCFNASGTQFISSSFDRMIKLWDTETGRCINRFTTGKTPHVIRFNPDAEYAHEFLAGMSDKKIVQFDTRTREVVQEYDHHLAAINTIVFVDQNRRFMTTSDDRSVRAWDYNIPVPIKYIANEEMFPLTRVAMHPNAKYVAYQSSDNQIVIYGANDKFRVNHRKVFKDHHNAGTAIDVAFSPDGQFIASGDSTGQVFFWDWKTCKLYSQLKASDQAITCVQWHPQETSKVVTAGLAGDIRLWD